MEYISDLAVILASAYFVIAIGASCCLCCWYWRMKRLLAVQVEEPEPGDRLFTINETQV